MSQTVNSATHQIRSDRASELLRAKLLRFDKREVLLAKIADTESAKDSYTVTNCEGFGRTRVFKKFKMHASFEDSLFNIRSQCMLISNYPDEAMTKTQVFQLAGCTWRCWYCYVDYHSLSGNSKYGEFMSPSRILNYYQAEKQPPLIIDLSGGQPDLVPEWVFWIMEELDSRGLRSTVYLRSEDNLVNRYISEKLSSSQQDYVTSFPLYTRIGCIKGFDEISFEYNTHSCGRGLLEQIEVIKHLLDLRIDTFLHATFTGRIEADVDGGIPRLLDNLQRIHPLLPLRVVPLVIRETPLLSSRTTVLSEPKAVEKAALKKWHHELQARFTTTQLKTQVNKIMI